jgi:hypothetical protein
MVFFCCGNHGSEDELYKWNFLSLSLSVSPFYHLVCLSFDEETLSLHRSNIPIFFCHHSVPQNVLRVVRAEKQIFLSKGIYFV